MSASIPYRAARAFSKFDRLGAADLEQEAWTAFLRARATFDPERGVPFAGYAFSACRRWLHGHVRRAIMPVSCPLAEAVKQPAFPRAGTISFEEWIERDERTPEFYAAELERIGQIATLTLQLLEPLGDARAPVCRILAKESTAAEESARTGIDRTRLHVATRRARRLLFGSSELLQLWREE